MDKKLFLILGNGFSIDFLKHIGSIDDIDLVNLFRFGAHVPWPVTGMPGFLSFKHCPNLWNLGARPNMSASDAMSLIEDIITCVNAFASRPKKPKMSPDYKPNYIYIFAYKELLEYLKHLFIFYNNRLEDKNINVDNWPWFKFIKHAYKSKDYKKITIVTYNYDIWIERILKKYRIPFSLGEIANKNTKITILKPHGSISFAHKTKNFKSAYSINYNHDLPDGKPDEFEVKYDALDENYVQSALIPPAGESSRFNHTWSYKIREVAKKTAEDLNGDDDLYLCGLSYWHVDRAEIDEIMVRCDPSINMTMVNPNPPRTITSVLTSIFSNFITYPGSDILEKRIV